MGDDSPGRPVPVRRKICTSTDSQRIPTAVLYTDQFLVFVPKRQPDSALLFDTYPESDIYAGVFS